MLDAGQSVANELQFDEATTRRRLIDQELLEAGWEVGDNGLSTEQVGQEVEIINQPTATGLGYADYVLWDDNGKPLAVIEAKKTAISSESGRKQAELYADGLEQMHEQRPIIFYTNGFETFIWNDQQYEPPRRLFGFYSKDSLQYLHFQQREKRPLETNRIDPEIVDRLYQIEAIKRVTERFAYKHRKVLIVLATGTGKTRVAVALSKLLTEARWVKRILFLCDRKELLNQANNVFKEYLPAEPRIIVSATTAQNLDKRIYLATYPSMIKYFENFDVGFFDLIIADEAHRSIYNYYRDLLQYFDCLQVGLTATPIKFVSRNTYRLFGCEDQDPTTYFSYTDAINNNPPYLVPFEVYKYTTEFQRQGIKYTQLNEEQRQQLEADSPELVDFEAKDIDKKVFNMDTNRHVIRNLMENGIREASDTHPKSRGQSN